MISRTVRAKRTQCLWLLASVSLMVTLAFGPACSDGPSSGMGNPALVPATPSDAKPDTWGVPIDRPGVENLHRVSDALYRGAQPTAEGMVELKKLGVRTIVNLRSFHSDRQEIGETGLAYEHIYMKTWHPEDEEVVRFLQIVTDEARTPVFVHCKLGADRTGIMVAIYRMVVQEWSRDQAVREMTEGGYDHNPSHVILTDYLEDLDIDEIRRRVKG